MEIGYVYVATTKNLEQRFIYQIGSALQLEQAFALININRSKSEQFYFIKIVPSFEYLKLEYNIHANLNRFVLCNNIYQCNINIIEEAINIFYSENISILEKDKLYEEAIIKHLEWSEEDNMFCLSLNDATFKLYYTENDFIFELKNWVCKYNPNSLGLFYNAEYFYPILEFFKKEFKEFVIENKTNVKIHYIVEEDANVKDEEMKLTNIFQDMTI